VLLKSKSRDELRNARNGYDANGLPNGWYAWNGHGITIPWINAIRINICYAWTRTSRCTSNAASVIINIHNFGRDNKKEK